MSNTEEKTETRRPAGRYKHIIRPDGTIRIVTSSSINLEPGEHVVTLPEQLHPAKHFYDPTLRRIVPYSTASLRDAREAKEAARAAGEALLEEKRRRLSELVKSHEDSEMLSLLAELSGVKL